MEENLLEKLKEIEKTFNPDDVEHLRDLLFIVVKNINILHNNDETINRQIGRLLDKAFYFTTGQSKQNKTCCSKEPAEKRLLRKVIPLSRIYTEI